jgi:integrase
MFNCAGRAGLGRRRRLACLLARPRGAVGDKAVSTKLTPATARDALPGATLQDHEVSGLQLRCRATKKVWHLWYRTRDGVQRRPKLGTFPEMSVSRARDVARDLKDRIARGDDPSADWRTKRQAPTVNDLCDAYMSRHAAVHKCARAVRGDKLLIDSLIRRGLGPRRAEELTGDDVGRFLQDVLHRKWAPAAARRRKPTAPSAHNHCRTLLRTIYNKAVAPFRLLPAGHLNPVNDTAELRLQKRRRKAEPQELARIAAAVRDLAETHPAHAAVITALFATGARKSEIALARVREYRDGAITLQDHKTAAYIGPKTIHLPRVVQIMLDRVADAAPDRRPDDPLFGAIDLRWAWARVRDAAGCPDLQLLDARRTFASYALSAGAANLDQIGNLFGHTTKQTTDGYAWLLPDAARLIADQSAAVVLKAWDVDEGA